MNADKLHTDREIQTVKLLPLEEIYFVAKAANRALVFGSYMHTWLVLVLPVWCTATLGGLVLFLDLGRVSSYSPELFGMIIFN